MTDTAPIPQGTLRIRDIPAELKVQPAKAIATAATVLSFGLFNAFSGASSALIVLLLIPLAACMYADWAWRLLPDSVTVPSLATALAVASLSSWQNTGIVAIFGAFGVLSFWLLHIPPRRIFGGGDVLFMGFAFMFVAVTNNYAPEDAWINTAESLRLLLSVSVGTTALLVLHWLVVFARFRKPPIGWPVAPYCGLVLLSVHVLPDDWWIF